jgi:hypothetical protein
MALFDAHQVVALLSRTWFSYASCSLWNTIGRFEADSLLSSPVVRPLQLEWEISASLKAASIYETSLSQPWEPTNDQPQN